LAAVGAVIDPLSITRLAATGTGDAGQASAEGFGVDKQKFSLYNMPKV